MDFKIKGTTRITAFILLVFVFMIAVMPASFANTTSAAASDISGHWAEKEITAWMQQGLIKGYPDGTFGPNKPITRAEFAGLINVSFKLTEKGDISFSDVKPSDWFAGHMAIAVKAGYMNGYGNGTIKPKAKVTRQEAAVILTKLKALTKDASAAEKFSDSSKFPSWSKGAIGAVVKAGYMGGYKSGKFGNANTLTKAEAVVILSKALARSQEEITIAEVKEQKIKVGETSNLTLDIKPDGSQVTAKSSDETIVTSTTSGAALTLKGLKTGNATVTVTAKKEGYTDGTATIKVVVEAQASSGGGGGGGSTTTNEKPVITVVEPDGTNDGIITLTVGEKFVAPTVTVSDKEDGTITSKLVKVGEDKVDTSKAGEYVITYSVKDSQNLAADDKKVTVKVVTNAKPVISVVEADGNNDGIITLTVGDKFVAPTVTASDKEDGNITSKLVKVGEDKVDTSKAGEYVITYNVKDSKDLAADEKKVTVKVAAKTGTANITVDLGDVSAFKQITVNSASVGSQFMVEGSKNVASFKQPINVFPASGVQKLTVTLLDKDGYPVGTVQVDITAESTKDYTFNLVTVDKTMAVTKISVDVDEALKAFAKVSVEASTAGEKFMVAPSTLEKAFTEVITVKLDSGAKTVAVSILDAEGVVIGTINADATADNTKFYYFKPAVVTAGTANITVDVQEDLASFKKITVNSLTLGKQFKVEGSDKICSIGEFSVVMTSAKTLKVYILNSKGVEIGNVVVDVTADSTKDYTFGDVQPAPVNTQPTITVVEPDGSNDGSIILAVGGTFVAPTVSAADAEDGNLTAAVVKVGENLVDTSKAGEYVITYNVSDSKGLAANEYKITVKVNEVISGEPTANITVDVAEALPTFKKVKVDSSTLGTKFKVESSTKVAAFGEAITIMSGAETVTVSILDASDKVIATVVIDMSKDNTQTYKLITAA